MKFYDISLQIDETLLNYPGDPPVKFQKIETIGKSQWNLSIISLSAHSGTHVDSDLHISATGRPASEINLEQCYGKALVVDLTELSLGEMIQIHHLKNFIIHPQDWTNLIILFKTGNSKIGYDTFHEDWVGLSLEGANFLRKCGIKAVGIDSLTIGTYDTHKELLLHQILVYEGLNLVDVTPGEYLFVGFPIKIRTEGAFVRAVLIKE
ncbi:MAG: cyclase family protein [Candidatus Lokiarchaeota archaeon]|nr:cyclase family protein [Candidatus Harpocratesius repetitus]